MTKIQTQEVPTAPEIFNRKFRAWLERSPFRKIFNSLIRGFALFSAIYVVGWPKEASEIVQIIIIFHDFLVIKSVVVLVVFQNWPRIWNRILITHNVFRKNHTPHHAGIPREEILDHIFTIGSFKREEILQKFRIPQHRFEELAAKLEQLEILVRGENNARVLNPAMTRAEAAEYLSSPENPEDWSRFKIFQFGERTKCDDKIKISHQLSSPELKNVINLKTREYS